MVVRNNEVVHVFI